MLKSLSDKIVLFFATGFGGGIAASLAASQLKNLKFILLPERWTGAGLIGTMIGFALVWAGLPLTGLLGVSVLIFSTIASILIADRAEKIFGVKDDSRIIIDEIIGAFWSVAFISLKSFSPHKAALILGLGFVLFRLFDVFKLPFKQAQDLRGGLGVVADDWFAGMLANVILQFVVRWI